MSGIIKLQTCIFKFTKSARNISTLTDCNVTGSQATRNLQLATGTAEVAEKQRMTTARLNQCAFLTLGVI